MSIKNAATNKNSSNLRYLLLIPFLISWYNLVVFGVGLDQYSYLNYVWLNLPQALSLIALGGAFFYFHRVGVRRFFLFSYLGLWLTTVLGTLAFDIHYLNGEKSIGHLILSNFGWPFASPDTDNPLSAFNSMFYSYNATQSDYVGSTVWSPNGGIGFTWLLLTLVAPIVILLIAGSFSKQIPVAEINATQEPDFYDYPVATTQHRLGGLALDAVLYIVTLGIGWIIWNLAIWNTGLTPGKQILKMRVYDFRTCKPAKFGQMVKRQLILPNFIGFSLFPVYLISSTLTLTYPLGGALMYATALFIAFGFFIFDLVVMFRDIKLRRLTDQISGTVVLNEAVAPYKASAA